LNRLSRQLPGGSDLPRPRPVRRSGHRAVAARPAMHPPEPRL